MTDKPNETNISADVITELKESYHKFLRLYERFASDRLAINKQNEILQKTIDDLKAESSLAVELKAHLRQDIIETLKETMIDIDEQIKKSVQESVIDGVGNSIKEFKSVVNNSTNNLSENINNTANKKEMSWWNKVILFSCGIMLVFIAYIASMLHYYMPTTYFTSEQIEVYKNGVIFDRIWNKLSKKEQYKLIDIENGILPPEEKSIDWYKNKYPNISNEEIKNKFKEQE